MVRHQKAPLAELGRASEPLSEVTSMMVVQERVMSVDRMMSAGQC